MQSCKRCKNAVPSFKKIVRKYLNMQKCKTCKEYAKMQCSLLETSKKCEKMQNFLHLAKTYQIINGAELVLALR
jgi:hypothetical protein